MSSKKNDSDKTPKAPAGCLRPPISNGVKTNFLLIIKEMLTCSEELCRGVEIIARENKIFRDSPKNRCRLVELIIKKRADISRGVGIAANVPSAVSVVGAIAVTAFTSTVEFISLIRLEVEMCLEIAYVYGKDPDYQRLIEALAIIGYHQCGKKDLKQLDKVALKSGVKKAVKSYVKKGVLLMVERVAMRIELAALRKRLSRFIPFLGMPIAAGMNYREALSVGKLAQMYYS